MSEDATKERLPDARVLIVDDEPDILASVEQALQAEGALTQCCSDGNTAIHICDNDPPDLVVLDMMLPKRSGFLVLEKIKSTEPAPHVIMVTANEGRRHQAYAETLGVDAYLHKPIRLERLILLAKDMLGDALEARAKEAAEAAPAEEAPAEAEEE